MNAIIVATFLTTVVFCSQATAQQGSQKKGEMAESLKVGDKAPDFEVDTFDDETVKLSDRFGEDGHAAILLFSRANW